MPSSAKSAAAAPAINTAPLPGKIRVAKPTDAAALMALETTCFGDDERFPLRTWRHLLGPAATHGSALTHLVPVGTDGSVGAAISTLYRKNSTVARIYSIAVDPAQRGRGLAKALFDAASKAARARGCVLQSLEVRSDNTAATSLYEKLGFVSVATLKHYYAKNVHATRYRRDL